LWHAVAPSITFCATVTLQNKTRPKLVISMDLLHGPIAGALKV